MTARPSTAGTGHRLDLAPTGSEDPALARWARYGVDNAESMIYVGGEEVPDVDALVARLAANGVDAEADAADGRVTVVDPDRFYGGGYDELVESASEGRRLAVRTFGDPAAARKVLTEEEFAAFEGVLARSWHEHGVTAVCRYDDVTGPGELAEAFARHGSGWGKGLLHVHRPRPGLLVLDGEADMSNAHVLDAAVTEALGDGEPLLVVDCTLLRFAAVSAWRTVVQAQERAGLPVRLVGASDLDRRLLGLLGPHPAFEVADG
ncbi:MEDS domain-containing protein [Pseudonocardia sp. KRD-184]|uniref:MEDS domain-containing protein n=1 Tax=Pseudonocardia oceani TaxID=2792013 RepID=A0ABS6U1S2_9PSEU|nr:MEDS domain-containing protein [Pseudonocardia oceani]MBW0090442.1 MEDS domain-containing protein [Pseudonocardia oceani]MBW0100522.1 MEDS domain-containing protein [Pseudonocardia oceani]MBW0110209.1 MEDS domain-containing protein [Pseudonocardia oceani]MBW0124224.1 MEDS domain-containing protein [Pseudonocardia oceani]MBW0126192.1 MEDS domain-containing protein [Pseudonocardia oceani]